MLKIQCSKEDAKVNPKYPRLVQWGDGKVIFLMTGRIHGICLKNVHEPESVGKYKETNDGHEDYNESITLENL